MTNCAVPGKGKRFFYVRFQVFTAVFLKIKVIRDVMLTELAF
jgi:hypothetical protein